MEEWRDIEGYEGIYQVSNEGKIKSLERYVGVNGRNQCMKHIKEKILGGCLNQYGYKIVTLHNENGQKKYLIHRLVAEAFIPNLDNKPDIDHINTVRTDNRAENLRWCTPKENVNNPITYERILKERQSEKHRKVVSKANKGKVLTEETKKKISESQKGIGCISINKFSLDGKLITTYSSIDEAAKELGIFSGDICRCCKRTRKTCGGFKWGYA